MNFSDFYPAPSDAQDATSDEEDSRWLALMMKSWHLVFGIYEYEGSAFAAAADLADKAGEADYFRREIGQKYCTLSSICGLSPCPASFRTFSVANPTHRIHSKQRVSAEDVNDKRLKPVRGAEQISEILRRIPRKAFYLLEKGLVPARKVGGSLAINRGRTSKTFFSVA